MTLGEKIKDIRKRLGFSQEDLAKIINVSRQAITKWENEIGLPDLDNIKKLSSIFNVKIDELLDYKIEEVKINLNITEEKIERENSRFNNVDKFVLQKFANAESIEKLTREVKLTFWQEVFDFFIGSGTLGVADILKTGLVYSYLVSETENDFLVLISKEKLMTKKLTEKFIKKSMVIDGYKYSKFRNNKLK